MPAKHVPHERRFWSKVKKTRSCWLWTGSTRGVPAYGQYAWSHDRPMRAHRAAWLLVYGKLDDDALVLHRCDNRLCVRPSHLFLGTHRDNTQDMMRKGRNAVLCGTVVGDAHHNTKLSDAALRRMRRDFLRSEATVKELAQRYGVSQPYASRMLRRERRG